MANITLTKTQTTEQKLTDAEIDEIIEDLSTRLAYWQKVKSELVKGTATWAAL